MSNVATLDNRRSLSIPYAKWLMRQQLPASNRPALANHFELPIDGKKVIYCYIRKNACTAFKNLICEESPMRHDLQNCRSKHNFMIRHHSVRSLTQLRHASDVIFVHRDPIDRIISLYVNKFIVRTEAKDILSSFEKTTGLNPDKTSFRQFVLRYLHLPFKKIDPHCRPQASCLAPLKYSRVIQINELHASMTEIIGSDLADKYFGARANMTTYGKTEPSSDGRATVDIESGALRKAYFESGEAPHISQFKHDKSICSAISELYAKDYSLSKGLENA
jgi:hypothetical protein